VTGAPSVASRRAYLRDQLPGVFRDDPHGVGLAYLSALETVLDPIVAILDSLPAYLDPWLAPSQLVDLLAAWLGEGLDDAWPLDRRRRLVAEALPLARRRGTRSGLQAALELAFPDLPMRVEDGGGVGVQTKGDGPRVTGTPEVVIHCDAPLDESTGRAVTRLVERLKPVHVRSELRTPPADREGDAD
jgi:phage tail-like protein